MQHEVGLEAGQAGKGLAALGARGLAPGARVGGRVQPQVELLVEGGLAAAALERLVLGVRTLVPLQLAPLGKLQGALAALERALEGETTCQCGS